MPQAGCSTSGCLFGGKREWLRHAGTELFHVILKDVASADPGDLFSSREVCGPSARCCAMP